MSEGDRQSSAQSRIVVGVIIIVVGLSLLADRFGDRELRFTSHMWPFVLIVIGVVRALDGRYAPDGRSRSRRPGLWLIYLGVWGLITEFHLFGFNYGSSWPLLVIGAGLMIVGRAIDPHSASGPPGVPPELHPNAHGTPGVDLERATGRTAEPREHQS
jgi:LiaF transmembrane domain